MIEGVYRLGKHALEYVGVNVLSWVKIVQCVSVRSTPYLSENTSLCTTCLVQDALVSV
jgi:hypothetical protein